HAILDESVDPTFLDDFNRPALAQTFAQYGNGGTFTAVVNHLKSKGSDCDDIGDFDIGDGQGNCNITRTTAATALANWLATDPTGSGDADFLIMGDLNAYAMEDPIMSLTGAGYTNLVDAFNGEYSYQFFGQSGYLDHALSNAALTSQVTGVAPWHINGDEPSALNYNDFNQPDLYNADPYRASDHDPIMIGLNLDRATNANGCYVLALGDSPFTGPATTLSIGDPGYTPGNFQARRWGSSEGLSRMACYEIHGTDDRDVIIGGNSSDMLFGYGGDDVLVGLKGQDKFTGGTGTDRMHGNQGIDEVLDYEFGIDVCNSIEIGC
ncbi:MAG: hypothetical protein GY943_29675, partial [Chloroflexi bacterium]|nr:hypothetical protein [Chloroflexota bacterium]